MSHAPRSVVQSLWTRAPKSLEFESSRARELETVSQIVVPFPEIVRAKAPALMALA